MASNEVIEFARCAKSPVHYLNTHGYVFDAGKKKVGPMTCFSYQNDCLNKFHKHQNNIILKSRQCLPENTYVDTPDGPKAIKDFKVGDEVYSYNLISNEIEVDAVYDAWCSGDRQCVKFKLQDTRDFEVGENHPFYVKNIGWVKAKGLKRGDEIIDVNFGFGDINADENEIKLLAYLITDGSTNNNIKYLKEFEESVNSIFQELLVRKSQKLNGYDYFPHQIHRTNLKNQIMDWCEIKEIANKKTEFKQLPKEVFYWNKKSTLLLINRLFSVDGWISILRKGENSKGLELGIGSQSEEFLNQIKSLLKKFNIKCNIYEVKNMKLQQNRFFKLIITHSKSATRFVKNIGIFDKVTKEHYDICDSYKHNVKDNPIIKKIEKTIVKKCYDISVEKNKNFFVDGLLTHNTGLSVVTAGYVAWRLLFRYDEKILIIANDGVGAVRFLETVKEFIEHTPSYLKPEEVETNNTKKIVFSNGSWAEARASSPNAGRGESLTMLVLDETAFIKDDDAIWMGAGMALSQTQGKCIMISCVPKGTIVFTDKGIKDIGEFIKNGHGGYEIDNYKVFGKNKAREGNLFFNNGLHETRLMTSTNAQIEGTLTHKLWACKNGVYDWHKMGELEVGDYISVQYGMETWGDDDLSKSDINLTELFRSFDLGEKLPSNILEMSRKNIILLLRRIIGTVNEFDEKVEFFIRGNKLMQQVRMLLLNFGVLTEVSVFGLEFKFTIRGDFARVFYNKILNNKKNFNLIDSEDIIPFSKNIINKMINESKHKGFCFDFSEDLKKEHISRGLFLSLFKLCKDLIKKETRKEIEKFLSKDLKWNRIISIESNKKETYDFSLPDNKDDFWAHSVIYNGVLGHQTPNGTGNLYYKTWVEAINADESDFVATTVHWTENPNSSKGLEMKIQPNGEKLPWSPWYESECKRLHWDSVKIAQELDLSFEGSKRLAIEHQLVSKYHNRVREDKTLEGYIRYNYLDKVDLEKFGKFTSELSNMIIFKRPEEGKKYILGADVARGDGNDYSTIQVLDVETLEQCAEFREKISPDLFPFVINHIARMYNIAYVVIEANSFGLGVCFDIRDKFLYPRDRLYFSKNIKDIHVRHHKYKVNEGTEIPGFQTTKKNRVLLVKSIIEHMRENSLIIHSKRLTAEFQTFVMNKDKPGHEPGFNDDLIFALGIALYIRDTEFENVTASAEMYKSMLQAMILNTTSTVGKVFDQNKKIETTKGGGGLFVFNGNENRNIVGGGSVDGEDDDDLSWLIG